MHSQVLLRLAHVDPYGNYSSPHYKGTASVYKVTRERTDRERLDDPICKLSLTLPKVRTKSGSHAAAVTFPDDSDSSLFCQRPRAVRRQDGARVKSYEEPGSWRTQRHSELTEPPPSHPPLPPDSLSDSLLLRLSAELSEDEVAQLIPSLRLCRSAAQLVKLRAGKSPSAQAFHVLAMWRRGLTAVSRRPKTSQLARCLARMGRPDLAGELLLPQPEASRQEPPAAPGSRNLPDF